MNLALALGAELAKLRRSNAVWLSFLFYLFFGLVAWFVLWIAGNPEAARGLGLIGQKAGFAALGLAADWSGLLTLFAELNAAGAMIVGSMLVIYLFGREYVEGTAKYLLALPLPRSSFAAAKLLVACLWSLLLAAFLLAEALALGLLLGYGPPPAGLFARESGSILATALLAFALEPLVAWVTLASEGYLAPFGYSIAVLLVGNLMVRTGWARWCPWSIVPLLGGLAGPREAGVLLGSGLVMAAAFLLGTIGTLHRLDRADNCQ